MTGCTTAPHRIASIVVLLMALAAMPREARAQYETPPPPAAWVLDRVTVVHADSREEEGMTLVVRNGVIQTLRAGAAVPDDARRIEHENGTLRVYPGVVDAHGSAPASFPTPDREDVESWSPTREVQFFTPHRMAADFLTADGASLAEQRKRGIVASVVFPGRGIAPGQPSLILHRTDARRARELVLRPSIGIAMAFQGAQGAYPSTLMAQHAFLRQTFLDAEHYLAGRGAYGEDPRGLAVGTWDADLELIGRVARGDVPVFFRADSREDIRRVLQLSDELGLRPVIVGGHEAGALADELSRRGIPVLLGADFPEATEWEPDSGEEAEEEPEEEAEPEELAPAAFRERQRLEPIYRTAGLLAEAGVSFALTSAGSGSTDLLEGVRRAVAFGLSPEAALEALTSAPAELVGAPHLARLGEGMAATFIVTDGPLLDEGTGIAWTFVNGHAERGRDPRGEGEATEAGPEAEALAGRWEGAVLAGGQEQTFTLAFEVREGVVSGTASSPTSPSLTLRNVRVEGDRVSFSIPVPEFGGAEARFDGTVEGDRLGGSGSIQIPDGTFPFTFEFRRRPGGAR
jgi:hypothetical protein